MKLDDLRKMAALKGAPVGAFYHSFGSEAAAELLDDIARELSQAHKRGYDNGRATVSAQDAPEPTEDNAALAEAACVALGLPFGFTTPEQIRCEVRKAIDEARGVGFNLGKESEARIWGRVRDEAYADGYAKGRVHGRQEEQRQQKLAQYTLGGLTPEQHDVAREQHTGELPRADSGVVGVTPELSAILWRLQKRVKALEEHPERLGSSEKHADQRIGALEARADRVDATFVDIRERLEGFGRRQEELRRGQSALRQRVADAEGWRVTLSNTLDLLAIAGKG